RRQLVIGFASDCAAPQTRGPMDIIEFLLFIPLLIYGIALSQLLSQWKRIFDFKNFYGPFVVTVVAVTVVAI
ncbi:MAG: hypothetical protein DRJ42_12845, partial [Deltaproteobacteria bacterium]